MQLNTQYLHDIGITDLSDEEELQTLNTLAETLEMRVGMALAGQLSDKQLENIPDDVNESWLKENIPDYDKIAQTEFEAMTEELTNSLAQNKELVEQR